MLKIAKIFQKKSSPDKSTSPDKSASLDRSTVNDTGTDQVLALKFKYFQDALGALNQQYGDIQKISTALEQSNYTAAHAQYKILHDEIKKDRILKSKETKELLFKTYEYQAISAFRAGKFQEHNKHLLHAYKNYGPGRDESIIGLERWVKIYINLDQDVQTKVPSISEEYESLLEKVVTEVQSLIKVGEYDQARKEMEYLNEKTSNFQIFDLYFRTIKKYPKEALKYFEDKSKNNLTQRQDIDNILKKWLNYLSKQVDDQEVAAKAATYASKYSPNSTVATAPVKKAVKKAVKKVERNKEKYDKSTLKLKTVVTVDEQEKQIKELKAKHEAEKAGTAAKHKAELEKTNAEHKAELEALKPKDSPTKDTKVGEAADFSPTSSLPPAYTSIPFVEVAEKTPTAPVVKVVTPLAEGVLKELTTLAHLIPSLNWQNLNYNTTKGKAKSLLSEAVKNNPNVYETIDDDKILLLLADVFLSSNEMKEARIVCKKALDINPNIWQDTDNQIVLLNLAGVLLLSFSNEPKAKEVYSKAISIRLFVKNEHGKNILDPNTIISSKNVAQYSAEEQECFSKVCLSAPKAFQIAQALNCYPHTDVAKRQEIAKQLQQLAHKPKWLEYESYMLCSQAFSVIKDDQILRQDMKAAYERSSLKIDPIHFPYPPTEESTCYLLGTCATNEY